MTLIPFTIFQAGVCGSNNIVTLLLLRFFAGMFGCSTMTNAGGIISDMFTAKDRGLAMGVVSWTVFRGAAQNGSPKRHLASISADAQSSA